MTATTPQTYTHVGRRPHTGYRTRSVKLANHREPNAGRDHALTGTARPYEGAEYTAACGVVVDAEFSAYEDGCINVWTAPDAAGTGVTCARCRKLLGLRRYAVQFRPAGVPQWYTAKDGTFGTKAEVEAKMAEMRTRNPRSSFRVRLV